MNIFIGAVFGVLFFMFLSLFFLGIERVKAKKRIQKEIDSRTINHFSKGQSDTVNVISKTGKLLFCFWEGTTFQFVSEKTESALTNAVKFFCPISGESEVFLISIQNSRTLDVIRGLSYQNENIPDPDCSFYQTTRELFEQECG